MAAGQVFGLDRSHCLIPKSEIRSGGPPKDGIPALSFPETIPVSQNNYWRPDTEVVGVVIGNEARAYPIGVLNWHEAINDTLGGVPIVVTYCPLCRSALVFHREVGGIVREFGISGLLHQSNVLLYDRQDTSRKESLWSQARMRAVCGPAAVQKLTLELLDSSLTTLAEWSRRNPNSTVLTANIGHLRDYTQPAYVEYFQSDTLMFPVTGQTNRRPDLADKDLLVVLAVGNQLKGYPYKDLEAAGEEGITDRLGDTLLHLRLHPIGRFVEVDRLEGANPVPIRRSTMFWFIYDAIHPSSEVYHPER
jgi:hypothetical protein